MGYESSNRRVIKKAFEKLKNNKDAIIEDGMSRLLNDAVAYAISIHDIEHFGHRTTGNTYGWALLLDGVIKRIWTNAGRHGQGDAEEQLREVSRMAKQSGWVGIILSSMYLSFGRRKPIYFEVDYELGVIYMTQDEIKDHFTEYFKPIA